MGYIKNKPSTNLLENVELMVELYDAYEALSEKKEFKTFMNGFMEVFKSNQVGMLSHPDVNEDGEKVLITNLKSISAMENFMHTIEQLGPRAKEAIRMAEQADMEDSEEVVTLETEVGVD